MAARVLVEQRLVKQHVADVDRRLLRNQSDLAQIRRARIHLHHLLQQLLARLRMNLADLTVLKRHGKAVDQLSLVGQRLRRDQRSFRLSTHGRCVDLLRRHVRVVIDVLRRILAATHEIRRRDQADLKIGPVRAVVTQLRETLRVQPLALLDKALIVRLPVLDRVALFVQVHTLEDQFPQMVHGLRGRLLGKYFLRPFFGRCSGDHPLVFILHRVAERLENLRARGICLHHLLHIHALASVGIVGHDVDLARQIFHLLLHLLALPLMHTRQFAQRHMLVVLAHQLLVLPLHAHCGSAGRVSLGHHHMYEPRLVDCGRDLNFLFGLHIHAHTDNESRILPEQCILHHLTNPPLPYRAPACLPLRTLRRRSR